MVGRGGIDVGHQTASHLEKSNDRMGVGGQLDSCYAIRNVLGDVLYQCLPQLYVHARKLGERREIPRSFIPMKEQRIHIQVIHIHIQVIQEYTYKNTHKSDPHTHTSDTRIHIQEYTYKCTM
jgi:hypothetical protein